MKFIAHRDDTGREQPLKVHLQNTAELAGRFADCFGGYEWGYCAGMLHDIGKYSEAFQERIYGENRKVDHATAGAQLCYKTGGYYSYLSSCIAGHHAGLPDTGSKSDPSSLCGRMIKPVEDYSSYQTEIDVPVIHRPPFAIKQGPGQYFSLSVLIRMLYSCLVDADFLDTEEFMRAGETERQPGESMLCLWKKLEKQIEGWLKEEDLTTINGRRTEILKNCIEKGELERGLFSLTVPTGGGKTIASLAFALCHAVKHQMKHIIYVIPYTSIIEQNAEVFRSILGEENVMENHCNIEYDSREELRPMQLAAENWDKPVIVTTNVQFFESLFASRSSKCRKLHNIADSVVIFDEAQMLPNDYLKPCTAMMEELLAHYRTSLVLCTATQPALEPFFSEEWKAMELCPDVPEQFVFFQRSLFRDLGCITEDELMEKLEQETQALCILNTKKEVQKLYERMKGEGIYHLSTSMYPLHRKKVLEEIRERLKPGKKEDETKKCIVISTSLVEAGVDLDFWSVYRQLAGLDSMIQAAGRCNREGKQKAEDSITGIFTLEGSPVVRSQAQQIAVAEALMEEETEFTSLDSVKSYFKRLYHYRGTGLDKKKIMEQFESMSFPFRQVSREFKLIEENTVTVLIPKEENAVQLLEEICYRGLTRKRMRQAGQYCISLYANYAEKLLGAGMLEKVVEDAEDFYVLKNLEQYSDEMGMVLNVEFGEAVVW